MRSEQIALMQSTFEFLRPMAKTVARLFYLRLFEVAPSLRPLFKGSIKKQAHKLTEMLALVVRSLHTPEVIMSEIHGLGKRHVDYGVKAEHYDTVGAALLWALKWALGEDFTPEVEEAWFAAYELLADAMKSGNTDSATNVSRCACRC